METIGASMSKSNSKRSNTKRAWCYIGLLLALAACLWVGWGDFDPRMPQAEVRETIRLSIRWTIQVLVQFVLPVAIVTYLIGDIVANRRASNHQK